MAFLSALETYPALFIGLVVIVGLMVGSFLNVVIHRLPKILERAWAAECAELRGEKIPAAATFNLVVPRSACPSCGHRISALENIPLLSFAWLGGKCAQCKAPIAKR